LPGVPKLQSGSVGVVVLGEGSLARQLFMNFVWLVGTYLFAAVLGVITGDIMERIQVNFTETLVVCHSAYHRFPPCCRGAGRHHWRHHGAHPGALYQQPCTLARGLSLSTILLGK
jgi:hypothetical protein